MSANKIGNDGRQQKQQKTTTNERNSTKSAFLDILNRPSTHALVHDTTETNDTNSENARGGLSMESNKI